MKPRPLLKRRSHLPRGPDHWRVTGVPPRVVFSTVLEDKEAFKRKKKNQECDLYFLNPPCVTVELFVSDDFGVKQIKLTPEVIYCFANLGPENQLCIRCFFLSAQIRERLQIEQKMAQGSQIFRGP